MKIATISLICLAMGFGLRGCFSSENVESRGSGIVALDKTPYFVSSVVSVGSLACFVGDDDLGESWVVCDGQYLDRTEFSKLFDLIGYSFGKADNDSVRFRVPDYQGTVAHLAEDSFQALTLKWADSYSKGKSRLSRMEALGVRPVEASWYVKAK